MTGRPLTDSPVIELRYPRVSSSAPMLARGCRLGAVGSRRLNDRCRILRGTGRNPTRVPPHLPAPSPYGGGASIGGDNALGHLHAAFCRGIPLARAAAFVVYIGILQAVRWILIKMMR
jgi:hypothetical protein